jgi:hypothetical protein
VEDQPGAEDWAAVSDAIRERMRELKMSKAMLARETGLSETTIRHLGRSAGGHYRSTLVAISAALRWRYDHLTNILHGQPGKNPPAGTSLQRLLHAEVAPLKDDLARLRQSMRAVGQTIDVGRAEPGQDGAGEGWLAAGGIARLPVPDDIDADYSPQYVKLSRILRDKIKAGELGRAAILQAAGLATEYQVSVTVAYAALEMLAANRYIGRPDGARFYRVTWDTGHPHAQAGR